MTVVTWPRKPSRTRSTTVPKCFFIWWVHLEAQDSALSRHSHRFESGTHYHMEAHYQGATSLPWAPTRKRGSVFLYGRCYSQASIRYRVWTHTLFGSQRPATDPDITAFGFCTLSGGRINWHSRCLTIIFGLKVFMDARRLVTP